MISKIQNNKIENILKRFNISVNFEEKKEDHIMESLDMPTVWTYGQFGHTDSLDIPRQFGHTDSLEIPTFWTYSNKKRLTRDPKNEP